MRAPSIVLLSLLALAAATPGRAAEDAAPACAHPESAIGLSRTIEIDAKAGPIFGALTKQAREPSFLQPKEVVLTFDDGPMPWITKSILETLDQHCTKATFFSVGKMALAYPGMIQEELARGHTVGSHTYTHPYNLGHMRTEKARDEIERGVAAVATAAGVPTAPFFRFTGLADSAALMGYLQTRGIAAFTVDVVSNDSYIREKQKLVDFTLKEIEQTKGGIVLFHDIKATTAKALPEILATLKARGYTVVHIVPKAPVEPQPQIMAELASKLAKTPESAKNGKVLLPFYGAVGPDKASSRMDVTSIAPEPRDRNAAAAKAPPANAAAHAKDGTSENVRPARAVDPAKQASRNSAARVSSDDGDTSGGMYPPVFVTDDANGWVTEVRPKPRTQLRRSYH